jgi:hypothetical protein
LAPSDAKEEVERLAKDTAMMERLGIDTSTLSFKLLVENGFVVRSFGQLSTEQQDQINSFLKQELQSHSKKRQAVVAQAEKPTQEAANDDELADFLTFCRDHPGRLYKEDRKLHKQMLFLGMWSQELVVLKRSTVEQFTDSRYVPVRWHRQVPLWVAEKSAARDGAEIKERRSVGSEEWARFRKNKFPYGPSHGLSVSSGGLREGLDATHHTPGPRSGHVTSGCQCLIFPASLSDFESEFTSELCYLIGTGQQVQVRTHTTLMGTTQVPAGRK